MEYIKKLTRLKKFSQDFKLRGINICCLDLSNNICSVHYEIFKDVKLFVEHMQYVDS